MEHKGMYAASIVLICIVIGMFVFTYMKKHELESQSTSSPNEAPSVVEDRYPSITRMDAKHFFKDGAHTIVGEFLMPSSCDLLNWESEVRESSPEQVQIHFTVVNHTADCPQTPTPARFKVEFSASEAATIRADLEGKNLEVNLIPAAEGESPEDFELFLKG